MDLRNNTAPSSPTPEPLPPATSAYSSNRSSVPTKAGAVAGTTTCQDHRAMHHCEQAYQPKYVQLWWHTQWAKPMDTFAHRHERAYTHAHTRTHTHTHTCACTQNAPRTTCSQSSTPPLAQPAAFADPSQGGDTHWTRLRGRCGHTGPPEAPVRTAPWWSTRSAQRRLHPANDTTAETRERSIFPHCQRLQSATAATTLAFRDGDMEARKKLRTLHGTRAPPATRQRHGIGARGRPRAPASQHASTGSVVRHAHQPFRVAPRLHTPTQR